MLLFYIFTETKLNDMNLFEAIKQAVEKKEFEFEFGYSDVPDNFSIGIFDYTPCCFSVSLEHKTELGDNWPYSEQRTETTYIVGMTFERVIQSDVYTDKDLSTLTKEQFDWIFKQIDFDSETIYY